jgi:hypothetical protein
MPFTALFADGIDVNSQEYKTGFLIGSLISGAICGLWPLSVGLKKGRPIMGVVGFVTCIPCGYLLGCLLALPVAFVFKLVIGALPESEPSLSGDGDSRYGSSDMKCGRCGALLMAGDTVCYSCRQPVGRTDDVAASPIMWVVGAVFAGLGFVAVKALFPW